MSGTDSIKNPQPVHDEPVTQEIIIASTQSVPVTRSKVEPPAASRGTLCLRPDE